MPADQTSPLAPREPPVRMSSRENRLPLSPASAVAFKMADGVCMEDTVSNLIEKTLVKDYNGLVSGLDKKVSDVVAVKPFYIGSDSGQLYDKMCGKGGQHEGYQNDPSRDDCRKKRCSDRYDSSESSDR